MKKFSFAIISILLLYTFQSHAQLPFFDGFESGGFITGGWQVTGNTIISTSSPASGIYCAEGPSTYGLLKNFPSITENIVTVAFDIRMDQTNTVSLIFRIKDAIGNTSGGIIVNDQGQIVGVDGVGNVVSLVTYDPQTWYHIQLDFDMTTKMYDIYINSQLLGDDFDFYSSGFSYPYDFSWSSLALTGSIWIDNVNITGGMAGINDPQHAEGSFSVYADPSGQLVLHGLTWQGVYEWTLFNTRGMKCNAGKINEGIQRIDVPRITPGLYILQVVSGNGDACYSKVMVNWF